jgi:threonylcarbamoyladenosine tRNA methylthiotransferase MtaB
MKIALETLGCKLNQAETETLARSISDSGHDIVRSVDEADIYILNTCTVTLTADSKARHLIRQAHRRNPQVRIVVTGCYAERSHSDLTKMAEIDLICGNEDKSNLLNLIQRRGYLEPVKENRRQATSSLFRTRSFVKIQDGCSNYCAYCIVPYLRTHEISVPANEVIAQVQQRVKEGYQEVVLTGTRIGAYEYLGVDLKSLTEQILSKTEIRRLRLSSLQPQEITQALLQMWKDKRLCPHFHLSLQSGCDSVLKRMRRRYNTDDYETTVALIRDAVPDVAITTDIIVGFPGETEEEFRQSLDFCRRLGFARIHVFPFSPRSGTKAAKMTEQIQEKVKKERARLMLELARESVKNFRNQFLDEELDVLWEKRTGKNVWSGISGNYLRVYTKEDSDLTNKLSCVKLS